MYGTTGTAPVGLVAAGGALAPLALPAAGGGGMALAASGHAPVLLALAILLLTLWTLLMAARVLLSLWPKAEA